MGQHTDHLEIDVARDSGLDWETGCKVPTGKVQRRTDDKVRNLGNSLRSDKGDPVVGFGLWCIRKEKKQGGKQTYLLLSRLKQVSVMQEIRLHLVDTSRSNKDKVEDGKESELQVESSVTDHPECEAAEEGGKDVKVDLVPHIILQQVSAAQRKECI